ncbi:MAG: efflux RND transporter periplasmic adaptor subunit [Bacteroidales bacterium]|nr:efflux RND transporter periplasmic adaptor subunit [Bacteroidales bacterium]
MRVSIWLMIILSGSMLLSCRSKNEQQEQVTDLIEITRSQFDSEKMTLDTPKRVVFYEYVDFTGMVTPALNASAEISLSVPGIVNRILCNTGQYIAKGQPMMEIGGNDMIDMQRDYAESSASLLQLSSEYQRLRDLFNDHIGSQKELIQAESLYKSEKARNTALKIKLEQLGLDAKKIEEGNFSYSYQVTSPIGGYVAKINATLGQYIEQQRIIAEVVNVSRFQLKLSVFEKDIHRLKSNHQVIFNFAGDKNKSFHARLLTVGKSINSESKAIECMAKIEDLHVVNPVNNQYAEGRIVVDSVYALSVPVEAVLKSGEDRYVLCLERETKEKYYFNKVKINTGQSNNENVEITGASLPSKFISSGVYNLRLE